MNMFRMKLKSKILLERFLKPVRVELKCSRQDIISAKAESERLKILQIQQTMLNQYSNTPYSD